MKILVVNGHPHSGKDTFCETAFYNRGLVYPISTIDRVKQVALFAGWDGEKNAKGRKFLSDLKDIMTEYNDIPRQYVLSFMDSRLQIHDDDMVGTDDVLFLVQSREPKDIQRWVDENGARTLCISREGVDQHWGNHADDEVANYKYDYYLENNGTLEEWEEITTKFIDMIRKEDWASVI